MARAKSPAFTPSSAHLGFGAELRLAADKLRRNLDAQTIACMTTRGLEPIRQAELMRG